jgi:hypothetical protein
MSGRSAYLRKEKTKVKDGSHESISDKTSTSQSDFPMPMQTQYEDSHNSEISSVKSQLDSSQMTVPGAVGLSAVAAQAGSGSEAKGLREPHSEQNLDPTGPTEDVSQISSLCHRCLAGYQDLSEKIRDTEVEEAIERGFNRDEKLMASQDAKARFRAWAVNIAALQKIHLRSSLDFRLKDAAELRQRIVKILEELVKSLENASSIVRGDVENRTWKLGYISDSEDSEDSEGDEKFPQTSELEQRFSAMNATCTNLMKLSMIIRNSPSRDDYLKAASRYNFDSRYDIGHVKEKYGSAKGSKDWLLERFGKGITRRRQFLKYREEHHGKLARDWDAVEEEKAPDRTVALTKATTFVDISSVTPQPPPRPDSDGGGSFGSQTSYEQTVAGENGVSKLSIPPPPNMAFEGIPFEYGKHFQCPYCFTEQIVKNKAAWK